MQIGHQTPGPLVPAEDFSTLSTLQKYRHIDRQTDAYRQKLTTLQGVVVQRTQEGVHHPDYQSLQHHIDMLRHHYDQITPHLAEIHQCEQVLDEVHNAIGDAFEHLREAHQLHMDIREHYGITVSSDIDDSSSWRSSDSGKTDFPES